MEQIKTFYAVNGPDRLQDEINKWFASIGPIEVLARHVVGTGRVDQRITVMLFYKKIVAEVA